MSLITPHLHYRNGIPLPPVSLADEVEHYARLSGRSGTLHFIPTAFRGRQVLAGAWVARFTLRPDDKRMVLFQQGLSAEPPLEDVWIHEANPRAGQMNPKTREREPDYIPLDITLMGPSGLREFLEKGNMWSGRGMFDSPEDELKQSRERQAESRESLRTKARFDAVKKASERRRSILKIPFLPVEIDLRSGKLSKVTSEPASTGRPVADTNEETVCQQH